MVTTLMRQTTPGKVISKALLADTQHFGPTWKGHTLAGNPTYGGEMSHGCKSYAERLLPYGNAGTAKNRLSIGVSAGGKDGVAASSLVKQNGFGGVVVYNVTSTSAKYLSSVSNGPCGENTVAKPNCLKEQADQQQQKVMSFEFSCVCARAIAVDQKWRGDNLSADSRAMPNATPCAAFNQTFQGLRQGGRSMTQFSSRVELFACLAWGYRISTMRMTRRGALIMLRGCRSAAIY